MERTKYGQLRDGLWDIQHECEQGHSWHLPLFHDLIWSPDFDGWTQADYEAFVSENSVGEELTGETWELWPRRIASSRYYGSSALFETRLHQFRHLAARAYRTLCAISKLHLPEFSLLAPASISFSAVSEAEPTSPDGSAAHFGWLELIHDAGLYHPSPYLQTDNGWWKYSHAEEPPLDAQARHPSYQSLSADLFDASAEYIQMILEPDTVGFLCPTTSQITLSIREKSSTHTMVHRPTICIPGESDVPEWDDVAGTLSFHGQIVLQLKGPAPNQRKVLNAFERHEWPERLVNPFREPSIADHRMDETLGLTIEDINRSVTPGSNIRFGRRENGRYAIWKFV